MVSGEGITYTGHYLMCTMITTSVGCKMTILSSNPSENVSLVGIGNDMSFDTGHDLKMPTCLTWEKFCSYSNKGEIMALVPFLPCHLVVPQFWTLLKVKHFLLFQWNFTKNN